MTTSDRNSSVLPGIGPTVLLLILLTSWLLLVYVHHRLPQQEAIAIDSGQRLITHSETPPAGSAPGWEAVQLTDDWWSSAPRLTPERNPPGRSVNLRQSGRSQRRD